MTIGYVGLVVAVDAALRTRHRGIEVALVAILTIGFLGLAAMHTRGGMRWRWGRGDGI